MFDHLIKEIFNKTDGGLDIIKDCYPQAKGIDTGKMFAIRTDDDTPSAHIFKKEEVYLLKDFGDGKARNGIQVYADFNSISFSDAVKELAAQYGVESEDVYIGPKFSTQPASNEYREGEKRFEFKASPTKAELSFLGPKVTEEVFRALNWHSVSRIITCKDGVEKVVESTANFPIFAREMYDPNTGERTGYKIYEPRTKEKRFKFSYHPTGMHPGTYWHGLHELKKECEYSKEEQVDAVAFCSGERDALVAKSMGVFPVWGNSETSEITEYIYNEVKKYAKRIYLIPDIDSTGKAMGNKNLRAFPKLYTVWLPEDILSKVSDQSKACKDLRDWAKFHPTKKEFDDLLKTAKPYCFWYYDAEKKSYKINQDHLLYRLTVDGFWKVKDPYTKLFSFVHIDNHIVSYVTTKDIRAHLIHSVSNECVKIRNLVLSSKCTECARLEDLPIKKIDFTNSTISSQIFFFGNKQFLVTADGIKEIEEESKVYVLDTKVSKHEVTLLGPIFRWEKTDLKDDKGNPIVHIYFDDCNTDSKLLQFLARASSIHWERSEVGKLTEEQELEENRTLSAKFYAIGYMMHRKRVKSRDFAHISLDYNTPIDESQASGGVGKSIIYEDVLPGAGYNVVMIPRQKDRPSKCEFIYGQVTRDTDIICFDECQEDFHFDDLNSNITGKLVVNPKNKPQFTILYKDVPKFACLTNYVFKDEGGSAERRRIYDVYGDYFHRSTRTNRFNESRTVYSELGVALMQDDYPEEDWNRDLNLLMQMEQFYLCMVSAGISVEPPMKRIIQRRANAEVGDEFEEWADMYFSRDENLNRQMILANVYTAYNTSENSRWIPHITQRKFKSKVKAYCESRPDEYEFNPVDICNDKSSRRIKGPKGNSSDERIYVRRIGA